ncbi:ATP synthase delta chain, chloroplastic-like [Tasmannia lanceolata]|uniref:ATP synthase delta chain, chloroplastic-like n=1 Tax=Tasmannia lanceolata TaxID=3420 RepID=UPI004063C0D1
MAALQQSPTTFQEKLTPSVQISSKFISQRSLRSSFSGRFPSLKLQKLAGKKKSGGSAAGATMMDIAAASYASALADLGKSSGTLEETCADVEKIENLFSDAQVLKFFINPTIPIEKKREFLDEITISLKLQPHTGKFLNIVVDMKRVELMKEIVNEFEVIYNKMMDIEMAIVSSVVKLEAGHLAKIATEVQKLTGAKNVRIKTMIDPDLVAGFTIRYGSSGSKMIDMSVKKQLEEISTQIDFSDISLAV